jgi:hypothetical protein
MTFILIDSVDLSPHVIASVLLRQFTQPRRDAEF